MPAPAPSSNLDDAIRDYVAGEGCQIAARRHRIGESRLKSALVERGLWRDKAARYALATSKTGASLAAKSDVPAAEVVRRYCGGESMNALAHAFGVSRKSIEYRLNAAGVPIRGNADANRLMMAERTSEENAAGIRAAHDAVRGTKQTPEHRARIAATREQRGTHVSDLERALADMLRTRGLDVTTQKAVGPYNVDIATGTVAVEVFGGGWHGYGLHRRRAPERLRYILDQGWNLVIVWASASRWPIGPGACDYIATFAEVTSGNPPTRGEYRVIWGDGKEAAIDGANIDDLSVKPSRSGRHRARPADDCAG